jgi:hypothetical protein
MMLQVRGHPTPIRRFNGRHKPAIYQFADLDQKYFFVKNRWET